MIEKRGRTRSKPSPAKSGSERGMRRVPTQGRGHERVAEILLACRDLLGKYPFDKVSIAQIAKQSGIPVGTIYFFFPDRTAIFCSLIRTVLDEIAESVQQAAAKAPDVDKLLAEIERDFARIWKEYASILDLYFAYRSIPEIETYETEVNQPSRDAVSGRLLQWFPLLDQREANMLAILLVSHIGTGLDVAFQFPGAERDWVREEWMAMLRSYVSATSWFKADGKLAASA
ncbi:TetR/AcrR family transcriptional regulator [Sphingopyxis sp. USTB-05]|uniref:TetR/AcrR family transcriptional regulator n=1 Tax=Sphingopyxis sp. USTB-05 TaxID=2830667 RepID=UPI0020789488|nr:TetR/AcrR family transcriptional regulator [Sphingopyxis sp. USTB-05]USI77610.1 TetR/AcrR family transcriptional regulator [Sphingopyxis sp. USTB-05]